MLLEFESDPLAGRRLQVLVRVPDFVVTVFFHYHEDIHFRSVLRIVHDGPAVLVDSGVAELLERNLRPEVVESERLVPS